MKILLTFLFLASSFAFAQKKELLYPNGAPDQHGTGFDHEPALLWYPAAASNNTGAAVIIYPGGGYGVLCYSYEGIEEAEWFNSFGVSAAVCLYRMAKGGYHHPVPMHDAQRAIRTVRARAAQFGIDPHKIGVMGFSAGGHLTTTVMTHYDAGNPSSPDPIERMSCRPDFGIPCYAVVQLGLATTNKGSMDNLLGAHPSQELIDSLSNEKQVTKDTPQAFIYACNEDTVVPAENSIAFYLACRKNNVPAELHIFRNGAHGGGLAFKEPGRGAWPELLKTWFKTSGILR